jgi:hypothetical protein
MITRMTVRIRSRKNLFDFQVKDFLSLPFLSLFSVFSVFFVFSGLFPPLPPFLSFFPLRHPYLPFPVPFPSTALSLSLARPPPPYFSSFLPRRRHLLWVTFLPISSLPPYFHLPFFFLFLSTQYGETLLSLTRSARASPPASLSSATTPAAPSDTPLSRLAAKKSHRATNLRPNRLAQGTPPPHPWLTIWPRNTLGNLFPYFPGCESRVLG